jgi:hypothetical protein
MKCLTHCLKIAFLAVAFCTVHPGSANAQEDWLDKPVRLKVSHKKLEKVLEELSRKENFHFSYNSSILQKDRLVTLTVRESTLREALAMMLGEDYAFRETGNYVILRKKTGEVIAPKKTGEAVASKEARFEAIPKKNMEKQFAQKERWLATEPIAKKAHLTTAPSPELEASKQLMRSIIEDLVKEKIIADKGSLEWFGLDNNQFIVNAKPVADSLYTIFKARYLKPGGGGYYYGPIRVSGRGVFLGKNDLDQ